MCLHAGEVHVYAGLQCACNITDTAGVANMGSADVLIFHHPASRSVRIVWLCEELGVKYELDVIKVTQERILP